LNLISGNANYWKLFVARSYSCFKNCECFCNKLTLLSRPQVRCGDWAAPSRQLHVAWLNCLPWDAQIRLIRAHRNPGGSAPQCRSSH
jgi:hypothetical protein